MARLYEMTDDKGVRDMLGFLLARDTQHQLQWMQAIKELEEKEGLVVPPVPKAYEVEEVNHTLYNFSEGEDSKKVVDGVNAPDGKPFNYEEVPKAFGEKPKLKPAPKEVYNSKPVDM